LHHNSIFLPAYNKDTEGSNAMQLNTSLGILDQQPTQPSLTSAAKSHSSSHSAEKNGIFYEVTDAAKAPASAATFEAAEKASGVQKVELEIAAAAGLLRTRRASPAASNGNRAESSYEEPRQAIEDLKLPNQSHALDLFE
jgi:hypothetical protein